LAEFVGVSGQQIHRYETGKSVLPSLALWRLARALEVPMEYFFSEISDDAAARAPDPA
jgi:transcriptional regulator with XRE-family HTH domain